MKTITIKLNAMKSTFNTGSMLAAALLFPLISKLDKGKKLNKDEWPILNFGGNGRQYEKCRIK